MPTVHALRNEIRVSVGRYEREVSSAFTKEALAAVCGALGNEVEKPLPSKAAMRASIRAAVDEGDADPDSGATDRPLRKAELEAVAAALRDGPVD